MLALRSAAKAQTPLAALAAVRPVVLALAAQVLLAALVQVRVLVAALVLARVLAVVAAVCKRQPNNQYGLTSMRSERFRSTRAAFVLLSPSPPRSPR